jgi:UDP-N-acetylglucosamine 2-epimerase (non-hydrolysing)
MVFPVHPRTRARLKDAGLVPDASRWLLCEPLGYLDFMRLQASARLVLTDSGGVQEETTVLGVPCVTLRENTERPCTISEGTNLLAGTERAAIVKATEQALAMKPEGRVPRFWDGKSAERIADHLAGVFAQ